MKKTGTLLFIMFCMTGLSAQNVGIGTNTPATPLHVVSSLASNVATFSGAGSMWITLAEGANNRGYIGSFAGNPEDVDFGTYGSNATGKVHLTIMDVPKLTVSNTGNIGIGTTSPLSLLHVTNGAVLFDGTTGSTPVAGAGARMMWIPAKKAFRAGEVAGTQWDDAQIGPWSFAGGFNSLALGSFSGALGLNNSAYGDNSFSAGAGSVTDGYASFALGIGNRAKYASGTVVGNYNDSTAGSQTCCIDPLNRIFQIGNGTNNNTRSNAMTVLENGKVGIGTTTPAQLLDINGAIKIGTTSTAAAGSIRYGNGNFEGYDGSAWQSFSHGMSGVIAASFTYPNPVLENNGYNYLSTLTGASHEQAITGVSADSWLPTSTSLTQDPSSRIWHTSIWTGTDMIVFGGFDGHNTLNSTFSYNPQRNTWSLLSAVNAPDPRVSHNSVWTGTEMIVWGGQVSVPTTNVLNTGARYNPSTNTWNTLPTVNAPSPRQNATAVWTGTEMLVWGGKDASASLNTGAKYNPLTNTWTPVSNLNAPEARFLHTAVWTGTIMIVWGGFDGTTPLNTGAMYNPATDTWTTLSTVNAPSARGEHTVVWTGNEMIVWGGTDGSLSLNTGARYNPLTNVWTLLPLTNVPVARSAHTAVWTGTEMILYGGFSKLTPAAGTLLNTTAKYVPALDAWVSLSATNAPDARDYHTAVWAGNQMIVYGGQTSGSQTNTGGRYYVVPQPAYATNIEVPGSIFLYYKQ